MLKARHAGPASVVDQDGRVSSESPPRDRGIASVVGAFRAGASLLARLLYLVVSVVVLILVAGILLALLKANPSNNVVSEVHGWGHWLVGPFAGMFSFHRARVALAVNWGIAAVIYLLAGGLIARLVDRSHNWRPLGSPSIHNQEDS